MRIYIWMALLTLLTSCYTRKENAFTADRGLSTVDAPVIIEINTADRKQTIHNFGGSDAWACNFLGQWPDEKRNQLADWLFSTELDANGKPKGIGFSLWRFNIGAGSAAQNNIADEWRRAEGFMKNDRTYDWSKQAGQQWFLKSAKSHGVDQFVAFTNSPPVQLTKNGKAFSSDGDHANIDRKNYLAFSKFLVDVVKHFHSEGIHFNYLSPFNEPQWDWTEPNQEGTPFTNQEIYDVTKKLDSVIRVGKVPVKIQIAEAGAMHYLYDKADKPTRADQINDFFVSSSPRYLGAMPSVDRMISAHSYFTSAPMDVMHTVRERTHQQIARASVPLELWQTEYCILGDKEEIPGGGKDTGINTALYVARLIHHDLTIAHASAWHWWTSISVYDYKDGLIYTDKNKTDGKIEDTKLLWALGNYSRFIRPGSIRVTDDHKNDVKGLMTSSYINDADHTLVTVIINYADTDTTVRIKVKDKAIDAWQPYRTSSHEEEDLAPLPAVDSTNPINIPKRSITTLVAQLP